MADTETRIALAQEAIYKVRWVDAFEKDGDMATDEAIAKAVVKALEAHNAD